MKKVTVCERWEMEVEEPEEGEPAWFLHWALAAPKQAGIHLVASLEAYSRVSLVYPEIGSAMEYFGGMGAQALMIEDLFEPEIHTVFDFSPPAVLHLQKTLPPYVMVRGRDSYDPANFTPAELVGLDFGDLTVWKTREGDPRRALMDRVFASKPKAVVLTDIAARYLHLHRERYETILGEGTCGTYADYLEGLVERLEDLYGYRLLAGFSHTWSTVMAFIPQGVAVGDGIRPTPHNIVGLK